MVSCGFYWGGYCSIGMAEKLKFFCGARLVWVRVKVFFLLVFSINSRHTLFSYILLRLKDLILIESLHTKKIIVLLLFSSIFALIHLPNLPLMALTFIFAFWLGYVFYSTPNLYAIVIVHAFLGTLLHRVYELHMKIGLFYGVESHEGHFFRFLIPSFSEIIGHRW